MRSDVLALFPAASYAFTTMTFVPFASPETVRLKLTAGPGVMLAFYSAPPFNWTAARVTPTASLADPRTVTLDVLTVEPSVGSESASVGGTVSGGGEGN